MKSKRPWKKRGRITRIELNNGHVSFYAECEGQHLGYGAWGYVGLGSYESLEQAEAALATWWANWLSKQVKSTRRV